MIERFTREPVTAEEMRWGDRIGQHDWADSDFDSFVGVSPLDPERIIAVDSSSQDEPTSWPVDRGAWLKLIPVPHVCKHCGDPIKQNTHSAWVHTGYDVQRETCRPLTAAPLEEDL